MFRLLTAFAITLVFALPAAAKTELSQFTFENLDGGDINLGDYDGKVLLVVNTATQCGNTHQLGSLQKAWEAHRDQGLVIVGISSNDFGQEPRKGEAIKEFCTTNFSVDFPMSDLTHVRGDKAHPFFKWVGMELGGKSQPSWNFFKYLIGSDAKPIDYFGTADDPLQSPLKDAIQSALQ
ncbi:glutathione peroxidase [Magnetovibrio sp. PR-2]|uniref:glutathione peroxidase n=1 Tax=Magnetovibrio sp. PR-2 TaxID=3120356 RepID=UPI002FCE1210